MQIRVAKQADFLFEYDYTHQVVNDPGDFYTFVDNHVVLFGFTFQKDLIKAF